MQIKKNNNKKIIKVEMDLVYSKSKRIIYIHYFYICIRIGLARSSLTPSLPSSLPPSLLPSFLLSFHPSLTCQRLGPKTMMQTPKQ